MVMDLRTRALTNVRPPNNSGYARALAWSPSGDRIAYLAMRDGDATHDIGIINADGTGDVTVQSRTLASTLTWAKDGAHVLFDNSVVGTQFFDLFTIKTDGTGLTNLTNTPTVHEWGPSRTP